MLVRTGSLGSFSLWDSRGFYMQGVPSTRGVFLCVWGFASAEGYYVQRPEHMLRRRCTVAVAVRGCRSPGMHAGEGGLYGLHCRSLAVHVGRVSPCNDGFWQFVLWK